MNSRARSDIMKILLAVLISLSFPTLMAAQSPAKPAPSPLERWRASRAEIYTNDFGELARYRASNAALKPPAAGEKRVVFFGDSITDFWQLDEYFPGKPYINRGVSGQTTSQMLVRFQQDVVALHPRAVVILAGTNDIAGNTGPISLEDIEANYASLEELARANGIKVIFSSVLPVHNYTPRSQDLFASRPPAKIIELNRWLASYSRTHGCVYLDYFHAVVDEKGLLKKELAEDGLHPNASGYKLMAPLAEAAIAKALGNTPN